MKGLFSTRRIGRKKISFVLQFEKTLPNSVCYSFDKLNINLNMKKNSLFISLSLLLPAFLTAQSNEAITKLNDAGVTLEQIENSLKDADAEFYFKSTNTTLSKNTDGSSYTSVDISEFDPRRPVGEKWKLLTIDGVAPVESKENAYNKSSNTTDESINGKVDPATVKVISEDNSRLVVGLRYLAKSLPKRYRFFADCDATYTIDKSTGKMISGKVVNFKQTKVSIATIPRLSIDIEFIFLDEAEGYHIKSEHMDMTIRVLGVESESISDIEYTDFKKVK